MELRKTARYTLTGIESRRPDIGEISCAFDFDPKLIGRLIDLGMGGFGIEVHGLNGSQAETIKKLDTFMMTIHFGNESMVAGVKNAWHRIMFDGENMFLKCGVAIDVISPEDRLKLSEIIEKIRNGR